MIERKYDSYGGDRSAGTQNSSLTRKEDSAERRILALHKLALIFIAFVLSPGLFVLPYIHPRDIGRLSKLFSKSTAMTMTNANLKVLFHELPGGAEAFELMRGYCYSPERISISITPSNVCLLHCVAHFTEMSDAASQYANLIEQTEKTVEGIASWAWSEILIVLKQCQDLFYAAHSSGILKKCLDSLVVRIASGSDTSPSTSSPDSTGFRYSCDTISTESSKNSYHRYWWFNDLAGFDTHIIGKMIETMVSRKFDQVIISRFLLYHLKSQVSNATLNKKCRIIETVVDRLFSLDRSSVSYKGLFGILRVMSGVNVSKCCRRKLESMIGSQFDQATSDNLLVPAPIGANFLYDVNLVMRFLKSFLSSGGQSSLSRLRRVGRLMDMYIAEVAPDLYLKPSKFIALLTALPDSARDNYDGIYQAVDMYLEVHTRLLEKEKMKICCALNYEKLSSEAYNHLAQNSKFPSSIIIQSLLSQQAKLKSLLHETDHLSAYGDKESAKKSDGSIVLYAEKNDLLMENEKIKAQLQGMQLRVMELEKVCKKMQSQMEKIMRTKIATHGNPKSLPKMCS